MLSSYTKENIYQEEFKASNIKPKLDDSYTSEETNGQDRHMRSSNFRQNDLSYSYSDIDPSEQMAQPRNEFLNNNGVSFHPPQMQVFNYEPVFKQEPLHNMAPQYAEDHEQPRLNMLPSQKAKPMEYDFEPPTSVADNYRQKKLQLSQKLKTASTDQENRSANVSSTKNDKMYAGGRTKEQILAQRKEMMKSSRMKHPENSQDVSNISSPKGCNLDRLAKGEKVKVSKKEMLKLTKKNYQDLPEVRQKKEQDMKKMEYQQRMKKVKENEALRRQMVKNKLI